MGVALAEDSLAEILRRAASPPRGACARRGATWSTAAACCSRSSSRSRCAASSSRPISSLARPSFLSPLHGAGRAPQPHARFALHPSSYGMCSMCSAMVASLL